MLDKNEVHFRFRVLSVSYKSPKDKLRVVQAIIDALEGFGESFDIETDGETVCVYYLFPVGDFVPKWAVEMGVVDSYLESLKPVLIEKLALFMEGKNLWG